MPADASVPFRSAATLASADKAFEFKCPFGGYITQIGGFTHAGQISALGPVECNDVGVPNATRSGVGGPQFNASWAHTSPKGYRAVTVSADEDGITMLQVDASNSIGFTASQPKELSCPPGMLMAGLSGSYLELSNTFVLSNLVLQCRSGELCETVGKAATCFFAVPSLFCKCSALSHVCAACVLLLCLPLFCLQRAMTRPQQPTLR